MYRGHFPLPCFIAPQKKTLIVRRSSGRSEIQKERCVTDHQHHHHHHHRHRHRHRHHINMDPKMARLWMVIYGNYQRILQSYPMIIPILGKPTGTRGVSLARFVGDTYGERLRIIKALSLGKLGPGSRTQWI